jgi:hypothetical protein
MQNARRLAQRDLPRFKIDKPEEEDEIREEVVRITPFHLALNVC